MIPRTIGNYQLERELGRGGVAAVYLARHKALPRQVAVKVLLNQNEDQLERFKREAELTCKLRHPNIVEIYDHGMQGPFAYTVMEVALEGSLRRRLETAVDSRIPLNEALRIFRQIGEALDFAHGKGVVHRDVSPGNVLLDTAQKRALLTDFGIARSERQSGNTATKMIMGTPGYFSPEHLRSARDVTSQSDLFSLGLIFYAMLAGRLPWDNISERPDAILTPPTPLSSLVPTLSATIDPVILTLLAVDPQHRYATAHEALDALQRAFPGHPALVRDVATAPIEPKRSLYITPGYTFSTVRQNDVETALGPQLNRKLVERIHQRAEQLCQPETLVALLEEWSRERRFRRRNLGRLATFHEAQSFNIYFYQLEVLIETREDPFVWEKPDRERRPMTGQVEIGVWDVELPKPLGFKAQDGTINELPGSEQVSNCSKCNAKSNILCNTCRGNGRITETKSVQKMVEVRDASGNLTKTPTTTVENSVRPCPECHGKGFVVCPTCEGVGMVLRRKGFKWRRQPASVAGRDDLADIDEAALQAEALEIYNQTHAGILPAWRSIGGLVPLLANVEALVDGRAKIIQARVEIQMVPVTRVRLELNRREADVLQTARVELVDDDNDPTTAPVIVTAQSEGDSGATGEMHTLHLLGFNNTVSAEEAQQFRDWPRLLNMGIIGFLIALVLVMLAFVVFVY